MLIALSGLPGTGKTTVARLLAQRLRAVHLRIDTIEQALLRAGVPAPIGPEGYAVAYGIATDNLRLGHLVIADCVNAAQAARDAWAMVAQACQVACLQVHLSCSDANEHRRRLSQRRSDIEGHVLPDWEQVSAMRCDVPTGAMAIDTSACNADAAVELIVEHLR